MHHNRAASYTWVFPGDTLTAAYQAESIRRLADALGMTIVREYEDEEYDRGPRGRPQFQRMMDEARSESRPFGAVIVYDRWRFAAGAADLIQYARDLQDAGVELLCVWDKPPRSAATARGTRRSGGGGRPEGPGPGSGDHRKRGGNNMKAQEAQSAEDASEYYAIDDILLALIPHQQPPK